MAEQRFTISVPDAELDFLRRKLELARLPDELEVAGWDYGVPRGDVVRLVQHWKNGRVKDEFGDHVAVLTLDRYDWRTEEAALNEELPMFTRDISVAGHDALNVHYVHQKSIVPGAIPLLFVHGCMSRNSVSERVLELTRISQGQGASSRFARSCLF